MRTLLAVYLAIPIVASHQIVSSLQLKRFDWLHDMPLRRLLRGACFAVHGVPANAARMDRKGRSSPILAGIALGGAEELARQLLYHNPCIRLNVGAAISQSPLLSGARRAR
jgi:hypothetical protein